MPDTAVVNMRLTPQEFDLTREALTEQAAQALDASEDESNTPSERRDRRARAGQLQQLLVRLYGTGR